MSTHAAPEHAAPAKARTETPRRADPARGPETAGAAFLQRQLGNRAFGVTAVRPRLQRACACGGGCDSCKARGEEEDAPTIQTSLVVGAPGDVYEREAEAIAERVVSAPAPSGAATAAATPAAAAPLVVSRAPTAAELRRDAVDDRMEERTPSVLLLRHVPGRVPRVTPELDAYVRRLPSAGAPMAPAVRGWFEPRMGADFTGVRVHADASAASAAASVGARAFTVGSDVVFGAGEYAPGSAAGNRLLAHELVHVLQQGGGPARASAPVPHAPRVSRMPREGVVQRAVSPEMERIETLLSYAWNDWKIFDSEAVEALEILKTLPRFQQAVFFTNPTWPGRLRDNLPADRIAELDALQAGVGTLPPAATVEGADERLSYRWNDWRISDQDAEESLEMLKKLSEVDRALALGALDVKRLMDNLPAGRRPELQEMLDKAFGAGGTKEIEEGRQQTVLNSVRFVSDHGMLKDETAAWTASGAVYPEPEWNRAPPANAPISHTKDTPVEVELDVDLMPEKAPAAPMKVVGKGGPAWLSFELATSIAGGRNRKVRLTSKANTPDKIVKTVNNGPIEWVMEWNGWSWPIGLTGPHTVFVTYGTPRDPAEVTYKRMDLAVSMAQQVGTLNAQKLVHGIMKRWGNYNLKVKYANAWELADDLAKGAQCIDIVRFVDGIIRQIGMPGTATALVVSAKPGKPFDPVVDLWGTPSPGLWKIPNRRVKGKTWYLGLLDANGCANAYEAALKFDDGASVLYYPGGVDLSVPYKTPKDVLFIFQCLAWLSDAGGDDAKIEKIEGTYPGGSCAQGSIVTCL